MNLEDEVMIKMAAQYKDFDIDSFKQDYVSNFKNYTGPVQAVGSSDIIEAA